MPTNPVNVFMPEFQLIKSREYPDSVKQVSWNGDEKQALISVIIDGSRDVILLGPDGDQKHVLSGHSEPVVAHDWLSPDSLASVSVDGEVRVWTIRGSRVDCNRFKDKCPPPRGIAVIPAAKKADVRFIIWFQDARLAVFDAFKLVNSTAELPGSIHAVCTLENTILIIRSDQEGTHLDVLDTSLATKQTSKIVLEGLPEQAIGFKVDTTTFGCIMSCEGGLIASCNTKDGKVHRLEKKEAVSAFHVERDTRTLLLGMKSGMMHSVAFRSDLSFIDTITTFEVHEFKITSIALIKRPLLVIIGGLDGVAKLGRLADTCLQKSKTPAQKPGVDWKDRERVESKIRQAEDAAKKGEMASAAELLEIARQSGISEYEPRIGEVEALIRARSADQQRSQATRQRLIDYLEQVAEERGEILLGEICKALSMPMADVKRWIKALDSEMEWEYIEQHECLILFDRTMSIARVTDIERQISRDGKPTSYRGDRRQLGRGRQGDRRPYNATPAQRQPARQQMAPPRYHGTELAAKASAEEIATLKRIAAGISGKMQASILGAGLKALKTVPLPDLIPALESISQPTRAIVTDGIISPRLASLAEKAGAAYIVGQRLHPNLDKDAVRLACIEMRELENRQIEASVPAGTSPSPASSRINAADLESRLLNATSSTKWLGLNDILASAGISDEFERNLASIKLKQLVASNVLVSEVVNNIPFFKKPTP